MKKLTINDVFKFFGSAAKTARALGISKASVSQWGNTIPEGRAYQIEVASKGKLRASQMPIKKRI